MSTKICWSRLRSLLRYDLTVNRKRYGLFFLTMYVVFALVYFSVMYVVSRNAAKGTEEVYVLFCDGINPLLWGSLPGLFVAFSLSQLFSPMKGKQGKLTFLLLPASALEKYLARLLVVLPFMLVAMLCALFLAELTHPLFVSLLGCPEELVRFTLGDSFAAFMGKTQIADDTYPWSVRLSILLFCVWIFSLFLLGGGVWYRHAFVKICGVGVALLVLFGVVEDFLPDVLIIGGPWTSSCLFVVLTLFNIWFPYYRFKRLQLGKNKLF